MKDYQKQAEERAKRVYPKVDAYQTGVEQLKKNKSYWCLHADMLEDLCEEKDTQIAKLREALKWMDSLFDDEGNFFEKVEGQAAEALELTEQALNQTQ